MTYIYKIADDINIDNVIERLIDMGYQKLPEEICGAPQNEKYYFKIVMQPQDGECVKVLTDFYNDAAEKICSDKKMKKIHSKMGIKYKKRDGKYKLVITPSLLEMFSAWRLELDFEENDIYFTISDGSMPRFYDAEKVIEKFCKEEINALLLNGIAKKVEYVK